MQKLSSESSEEWEVVLKWYKNLEFISRGAYGIVTKATHIETDETVAIKLITNINKHDYMARMVFRELVILRKLS